MLFEMFCVWLVVLLMVVYVTGLLFGSWFVGFCVGLVYFVVIVDDLLA